MRSSSDSFTFVDLFAGIGGFHAALSAFGGKCVYAVEIDPDAAAVYERNWQMPALGDIVKDTENGVAVPDHDVLAAGFPCQPFSKSGYQRGMEETRGTLFFHILKILKVHRPTVVLLENVRNIAGPRHRHEWEVIIRELRALGYSVSSTPVVFSPHLLPKERGGTPQIRERVFIMATHVGEHQARIEVPPAVANKPVDGWNPQDWDLYKDLPIDDNPPIGAYSPLNLTAPEAKWIDAWSDFVVTLRADGVTRLPGFPIWADEFCHIEQLAIDPDTPKWKANFLRKNASLYTEHKSAIDEWLERWDGLRDFPPSRRKFEWQAQDAKLVQDTILHFRPSGLRVKKANYVPALVAISQTSVLGERRRRISTREAARLQGLPEWFRFGKQPDSATYKQLGNGVNVGAVYHVFREHVFATSEAVSERAPHVLSSVIDAPRKPEILPPTQMTKRVSHPSTSIEFKPAFLAPEDEARKAG